jgi:hypothetical protein
MDESDVEAFRARVRQQLLERLILKTALVTPVLTQHLSVAESSEALKGWLDLNSAAADRAYGAAFADPALTGLYSEELRGVVEALKTSIDQIAKEATEMLE